MEPITECQEVLSQNIDRILKLKEMKKQDLAKKSGISVSFISDITNLKANPSINNIQKIADALNIPVPFLFMPLEEGWVEMDAIASPGHVYVFAKVTRPESFCIKQWVCKNRTPSV